MNSNVNDPAPVCAFICMTPLQLHIAAAIIQQERISKYLLFNLNPHDRPVLRKYFERVAAGALRADYVIVNARFFENWRRVQSVLKLWKKYRIVRIYFASIDTVFVQYFIHHLPSAELITFDDGAVNILPNSLYHVKDRLGFRQRVAYYFLRLHKDQDWIKNRIQKHFTIFDGLPNIVDMSKIFFLDIFSASPSTGDSLQTDPRTVKVFLGFSHSPNYRSAVISVCPDIYLPHPMERSPTWTFFVEKTDLIAEEYVGDLLKKGLRVHIYACNSTALLNLSHARLRKFVVSLDNSEFQDKYNSIAIRLGCTILSRDDLTLRDGNAGYQCAST